MNIKKYFDPETFTIRYWLHIASVSVIVLAILQYFTGGEMLTVKNVLWSIPLVGFADVITHTTFRAVGVKV